MNRALAAGIAALWFLGCATDEPLDPGDAGLPDVRLPGDFEIRPMDEDRLERSDAGQPDAGRAVAADAGAVVYTWVRDVQPIVSAKCVPCHQDPPLDGVGRALVRYADTQLPTDHGAPVHERMAIRANDARDPMPPLWAPERALTAGEKEILRLWSLLGAPEGAMNGEAER